MDYMTRLGHAHLKVRDLSRAIAFYQRYLNMEITERVDDSLVFMSGGSPHHELALQAIGHGAPGQHPHGVGLYHVAFELPDKPSFAQAYNMLEQDDLTFTAVDHLISWALYFNDPDGNGLELYVDTRSEHNGSHYWHGRSRLLPVEEIMAHLEA